jgi:hypothetical protein
MLLGLVVITRPPEVRQKKPTTAREAMGEETEVWEAPLMLRECDDVQRGKRRVDHIFYSDNSTGARTCMGVTNMRIQNGAICVIYDRCVIVTPSVTQTLGPSHLIKLADHCSCVMYFD